MKNKQIEKIFFGEDKNLKNQYITYLSYLHVVNSLSKRDSITNDICKDNGFSYIKRFKEMYSSIKDEIKKLLPTNVFKRIQGAAPQNIFSIIDEYISQNLPNHNLNSLMSMSYSHPSLSQLIDAELRFKSMCMILDLFGFRPEKKDKSLMNIDTDATHMFYGMLCDIFVTADKKLANKAKAVYQKYNCQTKILHPEELEAFIIDSSSS